MKSAILQSSSLRSLVLASALVAASVGSAQARVDLGVGVNLGGPAYYPAPVYAAPAPVVYPYYQPYYPGYYGGYYRHRNYDWGYWNNHGPYRGPRRF
jgi:hypothetical protein